MALGWGPVVDQDTERVVTKDFGDAFFFVFEVSRPPRIGPLLHATPRCISMTPALHCAARVMHHLCHTALTR